MMNSLNPFGTGQCLTTKAISQSFDNVESQSLWNRAVSYDKSQFKCYVEYEVSIPLEQGSVLRQYGLSIVPISVDVSIPLEQGSVLRRKKQF